MKQDLDRLMSERNIDVAVVTGGVHNNPSMYYMTNGAHLTGGILVKRRGHEPVLVHYAMERDEASKSGLATIDMTDLDFRGLLQESKSTLEAMVKLYHKLFDRLQVAGRVGFYGVSEQGSSYSLLTSLDKALPHITIAGEYQNDIFDVARATKDAAELQRMRQVGQATSMVMREITDFIRDHRVAALSHEGSEVEMLVKSDGSPLTVGEVKRFARGRLFAYELEDAEGMIFAIGPDAGVPHSRGEEGDPLLLGRSIVFDLFPRELGGGYYHDVTRTFCLGSAPPAVQQAYQDVKECFERIVASLEPSAPMRQFEELTCDIFEAQGHNTHRKDRTRQEGYVHSLGHGVGLKIHERPTFGIAPDNQDVLQPGSVVTIEPGLYYPERGFGVRIEDTVYLDEAGQVHSLTDYPKELVIEV